MLRRALPAAVLAALCACGGASSMLVAEAPPPTTAAATTTTTTATTTTTTTTATAPTPPPVPVVGQPSVTFLLSGHGWGHGAGLSQWGAKGYAEHGWTYDRILAHYYPGTQLGTAAVAQVRVLLAEGAKTLRLASADAGSVLDGEGQTHAPPAGKLALGLGLKVAGAPLVPPLTFEGTRPLQLAGK